MEITNVRIKKINDPKTKAIASITICGDFVVHGIRLIEGKTGWFVAMPSAKNSKTNEFSDICHPIKSEAREAISKAVINAYEAIEE